MLDMSLNLLVRACQRIGARAPIWTQGAGGNVSLKLGTPSNQLIIKASGFRLDQVSLDQGWILLDASELVQELDRISALKCCRGGFGKAYLEQLYTKIIKDLSAPYGKGQRASMEVGFHARLPHSWVFHFHSVISVLMADDWFEGKRDFLSIKKNSQIEKIFFLDHSLPGWELSEKVAELCNYQVIVLRNHGIILQSESEEILDVWKEFERAFCRLRGYGILESLLSSTEILTPMRQVDRLCVPLRTFFPDTAVFVDRILAMILETDSTLKGEKCYHLNPSILEKDRDAIELWSASALLYEAKSSLQELPGFLASEISNLPIEQWRKKQ